MKQTLILKSILLSFLGSLIFTFCALPQISEDESPQVEDLSGLSKGELSLGDALFAQHCAWCHGIKAEGGAGPSLKRAVLVNAPTDAKLTEIIQIGLAGTEMPGNWMLSSKDAINIAGFVRSLSQVNTAAVTGDVRNGESLFNGKGACFSCHVVKGKGISIGPELSQVGNRRGVEFLRSVLLDPGKYKQEGELPQTANGFIDNLLYEIIDKNGKTITAMRINEDAFTIQLKDALNNHFSFRKSDLKGIKKLYGKSLMPSIKGVFKDDEIDDLMAYLIQLK